MNKFYHFWLIDDDQLNNMIIEHELQKLDYPHKLSSFSDPITALEELHSIHEDQRPDIILLDIKMDEMTGWGFLEKLEESQIKINVIITTTSVSQEDKEKAANQPLVIDYLVKPIYKFKLMRALELLNI